MESNFDHLNFRCVWSNCTENILAVLSGSTLQFICPGKPDDIDAVTHTGDISSISWCCNSNTNLNSTIAVAIGKTITLRDMKSWAVLASSAKTLINIEDDISMCFQCVN